MPVYVALGDSMSIDDYAGGPGCGAASLLHRNHDDRFQGWHGRDLAGCELRLLARDGATVLDVLQQQVPAVPASATLITVTMGGNDLLRTHGTDGPDLAAADAAVGRIAAVGDAVLAGLRRRAGDDCRIVVTTVYDPSDGTGELPALMAAPSPASVEVLGRANVALRELAARHGADVADVHAHFTGHGVLAGDPGQHDPLPANRELWFCGAVEPNGWGAHEIRRVWWDLLHG